MKQEMISSRVHLKMSLLQVVPTPRIKKAGVLIMDEKLYFLSSSNVCCTVVF